jgi:hypothetical protein
MSDAQSSGEAAAGSPTSPPIGGKQAVVLIHGMGNQSPMETLRPFVEAVWTSETAKLPPGSPDVHLTWSQHDRKSGDMELWRITTNADAKGVRTDFFELYWADMLEDTKLDDVVWWLKRLLVRPWGAVPKRAQQRQTWCVAQVVVVLLMAALLGWGLLLLQTLRTLPNSFWCAALWLVATVAGGLLFWMLRRNIFIQIAGDAARYLTPAPSNIGARKRIRVAGLRLLQALHQDNAYDRIVIAGHSLGTVVGYDILSYYWADINDKIHHDPNNPALRAVERAGDHLLKNPSPTTRAAFRQSQRSYCHEIAARTGGAWKITDFITMGSPLSHAHVLMVNDRQALMASEDRAIRASWIQAWWRGFDDDFPGDAAIASMFRARAAQRELPLCPPLTESKIHFTYQPKPDDPSLVVPHHAALFAATRWTNIYASCSHVLWGDVVGGPVAPLFGPGVEDVALTSLAAVRFAHTHYWDEGAATAPHLVALRNALSR